MPERMSCFVCLVALVACTSRTSRPPGSSATTAIAPSPDAARDPVATVDAPLATVDANGVTLHRGDRVRVSRRAGTAKPRETGHPREVEIDTGRTGVFLGGRPRDPDPDLEPADLAVIRWDPQTWHEWAPGEDERDVPLESFVSVIHPTYLELIR